MRKQRVTAHESSIRVKMWDFALWSLSSYGALLLFLHHKQKLEYSTQEQNEAAYGWKISKGVASHQHAVMIKFLDFIGFGSAGFISGGVNQDIVSRVFSFLACHPCLQPCGVPFFHLNL
nr:uncharacterized protein LOC104100489 isoform X2 [Nicotiana tomentosiformis]